ncbi:uncharacterized protein LOC121425722 [Lytechinus variegatus]|uniref:uncharacterized protein LOC121425722 n=1 Tax=Lytechinus variegatus TaxID=7654 RepID=UPI001BB1E5B4|nr:uncharacterized protein LOC121425722 [Lytechinus variegatus]
MAVKVCLRFLLILVFLTPSEERFVNVTIEGLTIPVCESNSLCNPQSGCTSVNPPSDVTCHCDPPCFFFNDCCPDFLTTCTNSSPLSQFANATETIDSDQLSCMIPPHSYSSGNDTAFLMIDKCASDWNNALVQEYCEGFATESDFFTLAPVSFVSSISFKNPYCAKCNRINLHDVIPWSFFVECSTQVPEIPPNATFQERVTILMKNCTDWFFALPTSRLPDMPDVRVCSVTEFGTCRKTDDGEASFAIQRACRSYLATFISLQDGRIYRNPHCFLCDNTSDQYNISILHSSVGEVIPCTDHQQKVYIREPLTTQLQETVGSLTERPSTTSTLSITLWPGINEPVFSLQPLPPISVLIDFTSLHDTPSLEEIVPVACNHTQVFDPSLQMCIELSCPKGYKLLDRSCVVDSTKGDMRCLNESRIPSTAIVSCEHEVIGKSFCGPSWPIANESVSWFTLHSNHSQNIVVREVSATWRNVSSSRIEICLQVVTLTFYLPMLGFVPFRQPSKMVQWVVPGTGNSGDLTCRLSEVNVQVGCVRRGDQICSNNSIRLNEFQIMGDYSRTFFWVSETNTSYAIEDSLLTQRFRWYSDNSSNVDVELFVCMRENASQCAMITLEVDDFVILKNGSVLYKPLGMVFDQDDYKLVNNDSIQVCSFLDSTGNTTREYYLITFSKGQSITSFIGCLLSIACLVFTLVTYVKFASLRKSICSQLVMSTCVSLTLAQLMLLFSGMAKSNPISCTCFAVFGHYLWLVVFTHSMALAFDLYRRFGLTQKVKKTSEGQRLLVVFLVFAWGSPLLIVIPCVIVHLCKLPHVALTYGTIKSCWVGNGFMNLYVFGVPMALSLILNGILFALVVVGLRKRTNQTTKRKSSKLTTEGVVYLKMSTLLGFTWIFGFIAAFANVTALLYIFIILNSLQGVYIFIAFICNKRVFKMWQDSCSCNPCASFTCPCQFLRSLSAEQSSSIKTSESTRTLSSVLSTKKGTPGTSISMTETSSSYSVRDVNPDLIEADSSAYETPMPVFESPPSSTSARKDIPIPMSSQLMDELTAKFGRKM